MNTPTELKALPPAPLEAVECAEGVALVDPDGNVVEWLDMDDEGE